MKETVVFGVKKLGEIDAAEGGVAIGGGGGGVQGACFEMFLGSNRVSIVEKRTRKVCFHIKMV
jgi:hypothetical protein